MGLLVLCVLAILGLPALANAASFTPLGFSPGHDVGSMAYAISADGAVVVGSSSSATGGEAFRWTSADGMVGLGGTWAYAVSADGSVVVGADGPAGEAFRWTSEDGVVPLGHLDGDFIAVATGVSGDGSVVVGSSGTFTALHAFRWTSSTGMVALPGASKTNALAVSSDGSVIVGTYTPGTNQQEAAIWISGVGPTGLGEFSGGLYNGIARGISADGLTVVGQSSSACCVESFIWTSGNGMNSIGEASIATGIAADGSTVVGYSATSPDVALVWLPGEASQILADVLIVAGVPAAVIEGWTLQRATGISADGTTIVGYGLNPSGKTEAFIANIAPDQDSDGVADSGDNCLVEANPSQCDTDGDGFGNRCDGDLNNNGTTNTQDYGLFRQQLGETSTAPTYNYADINCNGVVNTQDYGLFRGLLGLPPGPSGLVP